MHELKAATDILNIVLKEAESASKNSKITDIYLVIGELSSYIDDSLAMYFSEIAEGTVASDAKLHFNRVPARFYCGACGKDYLKRGSDFTCDTCGEIGKLDRDSAKEFYVDNFILAET